MSQVRIDSEDIVEIRDALRITSLAIQQIGFVFCDYSNYNVSELRIIKEQVKRIDKLLPVIKFKENKK